MRINKYFKIFSLAMGTTFVLVGCTKLNESLTSTLTTQQANEFSNLFLANAYTDLQAPFNLSNIGETNELATDEALIPVRGGDWADGGEHVEFHLHNWTRSGGTTGELEGLFTQFNKLSYDATTVLGTNGTADQLAQARFLRAYACYNLLDLFGQFPIRQPGDNLLLPAKVYTGDSAVQFIISELNTTISNLKAGNANTIANIPAAQALLMKTYLNRGAFDNRAAPTFAASDMAQVISLGNSIVGSGKYTLATNYFSMFYPNNGLLSANQSETIFGINYPANSVSNGNSPYASWFMTLHYNSYAALAPNAGWNGFCTLGQFYNTFGVNGTVLTQTASDASIDSRVGGVPVTGVTDKSGLTLGFLRGQQYNASGGQDSDRKGHPLIFNPGNTITGTSTNIVDASAQLENSGYRVLKYAPDFSTGANSYQKPNDFQILIRYADVLLMIAEAEMRTGDNADALTIVNQIRAARGAAAMTSMTLVNSTNVEDPQTLLAERGRELYWENVRRTDLIRFGVWSIAWPLKPADAGNYYVYPITPADLQANPNLAANIQGSNY